MTTITKSDSTLWVAIDVAKSKHDVLIAYPNGTERRLKIQNNLEDFNRLSAYLKKSNLSVTIGLEASGYYHRALAYFMIKQSFEVKLISPIATARTRETQYNSLDKNDARDTRVILYLLKSNITQYYHDPLVHHLIDVQELANTYKQISLRKTRLQHSIQSHYLTLYFPEAEQYFCTTRAAWFAKFFTQFPCPAAITKFDLEDFIQKAWDVAGRKVDKRNWLKGVYYNAQQSIGLPIVENSQAINMFKLILKEFEDLCKRRGELEGLIDTTLSNNDDYKRLRTLPGVGPIIAITILAEAGNLRRFKHVRQFLKYCGFDLFTHQSGKFRGQTHLSKRGNGDIRRAFWLAATIATRMRENPFRKKYQNYIKENQKNGDLKRKAYTAVAAKMAKIAYTLILRETDYLCTCTGNPVD